MIVDTSGLLALFNENEPAHHAVRRLLESTDEPLVVSPYVIAELDYLMTGRFGVQAELDVLASLTGGAWELVGFAVEELRRATTVVERYADQDIGVTDASIVVLADLHRTRTIATLDRRHFEVLRPLSGGRFRIVP